MPRQQSGLACEECRARKLRCDRAQPQCGTCEAQGIECSQNATRQPRGPKPGHIRALKARIAVLERRLGRSSVDLLDEQSDESTSNSTQTGPGPPQQRSDELNGTGTQNDLAFQPPSTFPSGALSEQFVNLDNGSYTDALFDKPTSQLELNESCQPDRNVMPPDTPHFSHESTSQHLEADIVPQNTPVDLNLIPAEAANLSQMPLPSISDGGIHSAFDEFTSPFNISLISSEPRSLSHSLDGSSSRSYMSISDFPTSTSLITAPDLSDLVRADLNHLFFDRVHPSMPILNQARYFARASQISAPDEPFTSLQYAMWTLASSMGTQFQHIHFKLYGHTRSLLETWETGSLSDPIPLEHVQAWTLLTFYEITQSNYELGWISAGRCFRLMQLMKLHEIDIPQTGLDGSPPTNLPRPWVEIESQRRTFWLAYMIDRCINLINRLPLTLNEHFIVTRLPCHESAFQREQPMKTEFLREVMSRPPGKQQLPPFTESIILLTLSGRCLSHMQQRNVDRFFGNGSKETSRGSEHVDRLLSRKIQLRLCSGDEGGNIQPLLHFATTAAQATILLLSTTTMIGHDRVLKATQNILSLAQKLAELSYFKAHPFIPIPLFFCAKFLRSRRDFDPTIQEQVRILFEFLNRVCPVNKLARTCLMRLNSSSESDV